MKLSPCACKDAQLKQWLSERKKKDHLCLLHVNAICIHSTLGISNKLVEMNLNEKQVEWSLVSRSGGSKQQQDVSLVHQPKSKETIGEGRPSMVTGERVVASS
jgi:hypothetical protein